MHKLNMFILLIVLLVKIIPLQAQNILPQPKFIEENFLLSDDISEFNVEKALELTNRYGCVFVKPFDAVFLHVDINGDTKDIIIISDAGMNRLTIWQCKIQIPGVSRTIEYIGVYKCEEAGLFLSPSGMDTNAKNRLFDPDNDVIYVADRGNHRIVELAYFPDDKGGKLQFNREIGISNLGYPVDVAISAYGDENQNNADLYVTDYGTNQNDGALFRFNIDGYLEGAWQKIPFSGNPSLTIEIPKPVSVVCFPDSIKGQSIIYLTEEVNNPIFTIKSKTSSEPEVIFVRDMEAALDFHKVGGTAIDDYGRVYAANYATGRIEIYEPQLIVPHDSYGKLGEEDGQLYYPSNIVIDTYHDIAEALVFELYYRFTGLKTFTILNGASSQKPALGFKASGLLKPILNEYSSIPTTVKLNSIYPNPFNANCIISYELSSQSNVNIEVFNILGQKVVTLVDEMQPAGSHQVLFDGHNLTSGIYLYKISAGDQVEVNKAVLLK